MFVAVGVLFVLRFIFTFNKFDDVYLLTGGGAGTQVVTNFGGTPGNPTPVPPGSLNGSIGTGASITVNNLLPGTHTISARARS